LSVWTDRDLPVLQALAAAPDEAVREGFLELGHGQGAEALGLDLDDALIHDSLLTLREAGYVDFEVGYSMGPGAHTTQLAVMGAGMQALGEWPLVEAAASPETIALLLEQLAPEAPSEEESANMKRAATYVRGLAPATFRSLATGVAAAIIRAHVGL
jgi:hypothetical protein